jgi:Ran GTPase-activating protein (RanGAP) involved in mRNA processing and transport
MTKLLNFSYFPVGVMKKIKIASTTNKIHQAVRILSTEKILSTFLTCSEILCLSQVCTELITMNQQIWYIREFPTIKKSIYNKQNLKMDFTNLTCLNLESSITQNDIDVLDSFCTIYNFPFITHLNFSNNSLNEKLCSFIINFFGKSKSLKTLFMNRNCVGNQGLLILSKSIKYQETLQSLELLDLSDNLLCNSNSYLDDIITFSNINVLDISNNHLGSSFNFNTMNTHLDTLNLGCTMIRSNGFNNLMNTLQIQNPHFKVKKLLLNSNVILGNSIKIPEKALLNIEHLDLSGNCLASQGISTIFHHKHSTPYMKYLNLSCTGLNREALQHLGRAIGNHQLPKLEHLNLSFNLCDIDLLIQEGFSKICLKELKYLDLSANSYFRKWVMPFSNCLKNFPNLQELLLNGTHLDTDDFAHLSYNMKYTKKLKKLVISDNFIDNINCFLAYVKENDIRLEILDVSYNNITLTKDLACLYNLQELYFSGNIIENVRDFLLHFHYIPLKILAIESCSFFDTNVQELSNVIETENHMLENLEILNLGHNHITDAGLTYLGNIVKKMKKLKVLDLSYNHIGQDGISFLCKQISLHLQHFEYVDFRNSYMTCNYLFDIVNDVKTNKFLINL